MNEKRQVLRGVWLFLLGSLALYAALPMFVPSAQQALPAGLPLGFAGAAVMLAAMSFAITSVLQRAPAKSEEDAAARHLQTKVAQWALSESIAVCGLVLYLIGAGTTWLWGLCALAAILMGIHGPRESAARVDSRELARPDIKIG